MKTQCFRTRTRFQLGTLEAILNCFAELLHLQSYLQTTLQFTPHRIALDRFFAKSNTLGISRALKKANAEDAKSKV